MVKIGIYSQKEGEKTAFLLSTYNYFVQKAKGEKITIGTSNINTEKTLRTLMDQFFSVKTIPGAGKEQNLDFFFDYNGFNSYYRILSYPYTAWDENADLSKKVIHSSDGFIFMIDARSFNDKAYELSVIKTLQTIFNKNKNSYNLPLCILVSDLEISLEYFLKEYFPGIREFLDKYGINYEILSYNSILMETQDPELNESQKIEEVYLWLIRKIFLLENFTPSTEGRHIPVTTPKDKNSGNALKITITVVAVITILVSLFFLVKDLSINRAGMAENAYLNLFNDYLRSSESKNTDAKHWLNLEEKSTSFKNKTLSKISKNDSLKEKTDSLITDIRITRIFLSTYYVIKEDFQNMYTSREEDPKKWEELRKRVDSFKDAYEKTHIARFGFSEDFARIYERTVLITSIIKMRTDYALIFNDLMQGDIFKAEQKLHSYIENYPRALTNEDVSKVNNYISFLSKKNFTVTALNIDLWDYDSQGLSVQLTSVLGSRKYDYGMTKAIEEQCAGDVKIKILKKDDALMTANLSFEDIKNGLEKSFSQPLQYKSLEVDTAVLFKSTPESPAGTAARPIRQIASG
ncbi:MAG TPA: hypothetical protein PLU28_11040, partial [Petrotogaceae bacterium]|nr:hypothetical protein [Petrotogaceae bacterium]